MFVDKKRLAALLKWYKYEVGDDLIAVLIVDRDGLLVEAVTKDGKDDVEKKFIGAFGALVDLVLKKITHDFDLGTFGAGTFDTDKYRFIFCEAGSEYILVTALNALAMIDPYFAYSYLAAEKIARIFEGESVSPVIPKIIVDKQLQLIERKVSTLQKIKIHSKENVYKLILGGEGAVGKTSIVKRFTEGTFRDNYKATIGTSISKKECKFDGFDSLVRFVIWDLAGQPQFKRIRPSYLAESGAGILVFDVSNRESFENIKNWYNEIKKSAPQDIFLIIVGNKIDLENERVVSHTEGEQLANELGISYIETSAKNGENINEAFKMLAFQLIQRFMEVEDVYQVITKSSGKIILDKKLNIPQSEIEDLEYLKIPIKEIWESVDREFIPWLKENIEILDEVLSLNLQPIEEDDEISKLDLLAHDELKNITLIINQFQQTDYYHLGIILSKIAKYNAKNIIWICEEALPEYINTIDWLNKATTEDLLFYLIEIEVIKVADYPPIPKFNLIVGPPQILLAKRKLKVDKTLKKIEIERINFWIELNKKLSLNIPEHSNLKIKTTSWISEPTSFDNITLRYIIEGKLACVELFFDCTDKNAIVIDKYKSLVAKKKEIQKRFEEIAWQFSNDLEWNFDEKRTFQFIRFTLNDGGLEDKQKWDKIQINLIDAMNSLRGAFGDYIF
ncbi:MAG: DUF4268 domain-containing protein [Candidatus Lokiarchaeota archaeon]|nr:DUF4268 domain-containing protein [Candidatus Lokiarchaeota archaeon]